MTDHERTGFRTIGRAVAALAVAVGGFVLAPTGGVDVGSVAGAATGPQRCADPDLARGGAGWYGGRVIADTDDPTIARAYRTDATNGALAYLPSVQSVVAGERLDVDLRVLSSAPGQARIAVNWHNGPPAASTYLGHQFGPTQTTGTDRSYVTVRFSVVVPAGARAFAFTLFGDGYAPGTTHLIGGCSVRTPDACSSPLSAAALTQQRWGTLIGTSAGMQPWGRWLVRPTRGQAMVSAPGAVVLEGQRWTFGIAAASSRNATARVNVNWYDISTNPPTYRSTTYGEATPLARGASERLITTSVQVPDVGPRNAVTRARLLAVVVLATDVETGGDLYVGDCRHSLDGDTRSAAERFGWGQPIALGTDDFLGTSLDPVRWELPRPRATGCWPGHGVGPTFPGNGLRCADNVRVADGTVTIHGDEGIGLDGTSGWFGSRLTMQYGRYEVRVRSRTLDTAGNPAPVSGPNQYHPNILIWPTTGWPQGGEYDIYEPTYAGDDCAVAFGHYPHPPTVPVQQEYFLEVDSGDCGDPLSEWHVIGFEWTPQHLRGFVDGVEVYRWADGATTDAKGNQIRGNIQTMPGGSLAVQLDNGLFDLTEGNQPAELEVDWIRTYPL